MDTENNKNNSNLGLPISIVIAGVIIAGAIYFGDGQTKPAVNENKITNTKSASLEKVRPVSNSDHIRGNPEADIVVVEYSDTECPFCIRFHTTMKQIINEYGKAGKVAWVYRHSPIDQLHPKARNEANALECAGELGGNDKFWEYTDRIYEITPGNNGLDLAKLPEIAEFIGLDVGKFNACLSSDKHLSKIEADLENARLTGGGGTPWSIMILKVALSDEQEKSITDYINLNNLKNNVFISDDNKHIALNGALPVEMIKKIIDISIK